MDKSPRFSYPLVMGIVNVTPDSFSDGGLFLTPESVQARVQQLSQEGAQIIDIGAESTRPGATPLSYEEEYARLIPVVEILAQDTPFLSIDTSKSRIAEKALALGADMINDVGGLQKDPDMAGVIAQANAWAVIMHSAESGMRDGAVMEQIIAFFETSLERAEAAGISRQRLILDPGLGFEKTLAQNYEILAHLGRLKPFNLPILVGASRKRMIGHLTQTPPCDRMYGSLAAHVLAVANGAQMVRVHDVKAHVQALKVAGYYLDRTLSLSTRQR